jgi:hypothetical protein
MIIKNIVLNCTQGLFILVTTLLDGFGIGVNLSSHVGSWKANWWKHSRSVL